jgi:hypothetical protein
VDRRLKVGKRVVWRKSACSPPGSPPSSLAACWHVESLTGYTVEVGRLYARPLLA